MGGARRRRRRGAHILLGSFLPDPGRVGAAVLAARCLGMLSYGLVFQLGFLNFYLSTGLCLWMLAILWNPTRRRFFLAIPLALLALLAHAFPVGWAVALLGYLYIT